MSSRKTEVVLLGPEPRIAVEYAGSGQLILFLHGIGGNRRNWLAQIRAFSGNYLAAAWDGRGYGDSDDYEGAFRYADVCGDLERVLDHFQASSAIIVGLSHGGIIGQDFARRQPRRVRRLVICNSRFTVDRVNRAEFLQLRLAPLRAGLSMDEFAASLMPKLVAENASAEARQALLESLAALHRESYIKTLLGSADLSSQPEYADRQHWLEASEASMPIRIITSDEDKITPAALSYQAAARFPGSKIARIERAGHISNIEQEACFNSTLDEFLAD